MIKQIGHQFNTVHGCIDNNHSYDSALNWTWLIRTVPSPPLPSSYPSTSATAYLCCHNPCILEDSLVPRVCLMQQFGDKSHRLDRSLGFLFLGSKNETQKVMENTQ